MKIDRIGEIMSLVNGSADDTSDDIISEQQLYDYLCEIIGRTQETVPLLDSIPGLVQDVTADYIGPTPGAPQRLRQALSAMVCAYTAARYKQEADNWFERMKEEHEHEEK